MSIVLNFFKPRGVTAITIKHDSVKDSRSIEDFFLSLLSAIFLDKDVTLLTVQPQKYSLGYELKSHRKMKTEKSTILINDITTADAMLLQEVSRSEEFQRGLLVLRIADNTSLENFARQFIGAYPNVEQLDIKDTVVVCNPDGEILYLFNVNLTVDAIKGLFSRVVNEDGR